MLYMARRMLYDLHEVMVLYVLRYDSYVYKCLSWKKGSEVLYIDLCADIMTVFGVMIARIWDYYLRTYS